MNFIITKIVNKNEGYISWRVYPTGDFYKTLLILKGHDLRDLLIQIIDQDPVITHYFTTLLK